MSRWPTVTALWLGTATWLYAALAALELRDTPSGPGYVPAPDLVVTLAVPTVVGLGVALLVGAGSLVTGRLRRPADALLGVGLLLGAGLLWAAEEPRPVAPVVMGAAALVVAASALLPERPADGRLAGVLARVLLAAVALLGGWACAHELAERGWQPATWSLVYYAGLGVSAAMLLAALLGPLLARPVWRRLLGVPAVLLGLAATAGGVAGLNAGYLVAGYEEVEQGWSLGGPAMFLGAGQTAAAVALLRGRWTLAVGTLGACALLTLALVFGIPEMRAGF